MKIPKPVPVEFGNMVYVPRMVAIDCPKCSAEVRLDRFLADFPAAAAMINPGDRLASTRQTLSAQLVSALATGNFSFLPGSKPIGYVSFPVPPVAVTAISGENNYPSDRLIQLQSGFAPTTVCSCGRSDFFIESPYPPLQAHSVESSGRPA